MQLLAVVHPLESPDEFISLQAPGPLQDRKVTGMKWTAAAAHVSGAALSRVGGCLASSQPPREVAVAPPVIGENTKRNHPAWSSHTAPRAGSQARLGAERLNLSVVLVSSRAGPAPPLALVMDLLEELYKGHSGADANTFIVTASVEFN